MDGFDDGTPRLRPPRHLPRGFFFPATGHAICIFHAGSAADVTAVIEPILGRLQIRTAPGLREEPVLDSSPGNAARDTIIRLLGPTPVALDDLVRIAAVSPGQVRTVLLELELAGRLERHGGGLVSMIG